MYESLSAVRNWFPRYLTTCPTHGGLLSEIRDLKPGMVVRNTYRIVRKLGQGGMGTVYLAQQLLLDEPRALKFVSADLADDDSTSKRFLREVRTLWQVRQWIVATRSEPRTILAVSLPLWERHTARAWCTVTSSRRTSCYYRGESRTR